MDDYLAALAEYTKAVSELDKCIHSCEYDAGYFCHIQEQRVDDAKVMIRDALYIFIDDRIRQALENPPADRPQAG
jgi:hypothetical protein